MYIFIFSARSCRNLYAHLSTKHNLFSNIVNTNIYIIFSGYVSDSRNCFVSIKCVFLSVVRCVLYTFLFTKEYAICRLFYSQQEHLFFNILKYVE